MDRTAMEKASKRSLKHLHLRALAKMIEDNNKEKPKPKPKKPKTVEPTPKPIENEKTEETPPPMSSFFKDSNLYS